jgi:hypothetical protein
VKGLGGATTQRPRLKHHVEIAVSKKKKKKKREDRNAHTQTQTHMDWEAREAD